MNIYRLKHPTIFLESTCEIKIKHLENILAGITKDDIKEDRVSGRHGLILQMGLVGNCPLFEEYMCVRGDIYAIHQQYMDKHKGTSRMTLENAREKQKASQKVFKDTGWLIDEPD